MKREILLGLALAASAIAQQPIQVIDTSTSPVTFVNPGDTATRAVRVNCIFGCGGGGGGGGTSSLFGTPFPIAGTAMGASDGINMVPLLVDGSGNLKVSGSSVPTGTAGAPSASVLTIQGIAAMTPLSVTGIFFQVTQPVSAVALPLPTGASTSGNQITELASLASIDVKTPALGQALAAASVPVVMTAAQLATLTPLSTVTANQGGAPWSVSQSGTWNIGTVTAVTGITNALPAGSNVIGHVIADTGSTTAVTGTVAVSGTFFQATQPVSIADGSSITLGAKADAKSTATDTTAVSIMAVLKEISAMEQAPASRAVTNAGTFAVQATLAAETTKVIGTVNQGTSPWIVAGGGTAGSAATGVVTIQGIASMTKLLVTPDSVALPANQSVNMAQVAGTNTLNGGTAGSLAVGGVDANNVAITQNPFLISVEAINTQPAAATSGRSRRLIASLDGSMYIRYGGPIAFSCGLTAIGTTLTQCQAAPGAGLSLYITDVVTQSNTATAGLFTLRFGTGANCVTGTGNLFFASASALMASPANTVAVNHFHFTVPIQVTAANALCVLGVVTNTTNIQINGFTAP